MNTVKLTDAEAKLLRKIIPQRIERLKGLQTPEEHKRAMWPIVVTDADVKSYAKRHAVQRQNIAYYESILKKLGVA